MQSDLGEMSSKVKSADEKANKSIADAIHLAEKLRAERDHGQQVEKMRKAIEHQMKELTVRLDEVETRGLKGGKKMIAKLENRVHNLEGELDGEQSRHDETQKNMRNADRRIKELAFQADENKSKQEHLQDIINKLQDKIKTYKYQVDEAEEIAAINLAKYRKVQNELEDAEERADAAENGMQKLRTKNRSSASMGRASPARASSITIRESRQTVTSQSTSFE